MINRRQRSCIMVAVFLAVVVGLAGCLSKSPDAEQASAREAEKPSGVLSKLLETSTPVTLPEGTVINVTVDQTLASNQNRSGDEFEASIAAPVVVAGKTVIPKGARARGRVIEARESGHLQTPARLRLALHSVEVGGKSYQIETSSVTRTGSSHKKRNIELIGGGAGVGALIGGIAGGGKGALIGSAVGAGAGTATAAVTGKKDITIPAETQLSFRLTQPVTVQAKG